MTHSEYQTSDITLAATLKYAGHRLNRISIVGNKRGIFHFADVEEEFLENFDAGAINVEPVAFQSDLRALNMAIKRTLEKMGV